MVELGYDTNGVDEIFRSEMFNVVKKFQEDNGLTNDG